jgi:Helix-turn-helix family
MELSTTSRLARRLGSVLEPVVGQVYFSPECHSNYEELGFDPSPGDANGVALPDGPAYFASRGSVLGQVSGEVIAAAFGVFSAAVVVPSVQLAWSRTDADTIRAARADGALRQLCRLLGPRPDGVERALDLLRRAAAPLPINGRPMAAGIAALVVPDDPLAALWHTGDFLREYRGDCHNAAWVAAGLTATDIGILTELSWGMPIRSYSRTRGWTVDDFDASEQRLRNLGHLEGEGPSTHLSQPGRHAREAIEVATDEQMVPAVAALGDDIEELFDLLTPWGETIRAGRGYLGAGPHDLG